MAREYLCSYGDCDSTKVKITVTDRDGMEQARFCCHEHAGLYLLRRAWQYQGQRKESYAKEVTERVNDQFRH